jgi:hypothetical protein
MAKLLSVERVYGDGYHNAFTDLVKWKGSYYLAFRTAQDHNCPPDGDVLVLRSSDLRQWAVCGRFDTGGDDRDPKLIDAGDRIGVVFGTWYPRWGDGTRSIVNEPRDLISHVAVSRDGATWSAPRQVYGVNYWLWRILPVEGHFLCAAYHFGRRSDRLMRSVHLLRSDNLFDWTLVCQMRCGGGAGEPVLFQPEPGRLHCVIRALEPQNHSWLGQSTYPYTEWSWDDLGVMIHAPVVLKVGDRWIVAGRSQSCDLPEVACEPGSGHHCSVWEIDGTKAKHLLTVPSGGDCSYPGLAFGPDGEVLMSYYSQHERLPLPSQPPTPADVFLARFRA